MVVRIGVLRPQISWMVVVVVVDVEYRGNSKVCSFGTEQQKGRAKWLTSYRGE